MSRTGILFVVKDLEMGGGCRQAGRQEENPWDISPRGNR